MENVTFNTLNHFLPLTSIEPKNIIFQFFDKINGPWKQVNDLKYQFEEVTYRGKEYPTVQIDFARGIVKFFKYDGEEKIDENGKKYVDLILDFKLAIKAELLPIK